jgi:inner membrane protein involved in colicin E2 resistance
LVNDAFREYRRGLFAHYILTVVFGVLIAILAQRPYWMLGYTLLIMAQSVTVCVIAAIMYPTNWMPEETHKVEHQRYLGEIARIRGFTGVSVGGTSEVLIPPPQ